MKMYSYVSTAGYTVTVPETLHKMIQRGGTVGSVNGGKLNKTCTFELIGSANETARKVIAQRKTEAAKPAEQKAAPKAAPKKPAAKKPAPKKVAAKKPAAKKGDAKPAKVSKYGTHPTGTVQFVPTRKIYHGFVDGKIVVVKNSAEKVTEALKAANVTEFNHITFEG
ncbi:MAG TPA: hypothetical protein VFM18_18805 [Methanosarcina sp.]|nr:hypothetical protein [Methanosarcina sp.]